MKFELLKSPRACFTFFFVIAILSPSLKKILKTDFPKRWRMAYFHHFISSPSVIWTLGLSFSWIRMSKAADYIIFMQFWGIFWPLEFIRTPLLNVFIFGYAELARVYEALRVFKRGRLSRCSQIQLVSVQLGLSTFFKRLVFLCFCCCLCWWYSDLYAKTYCLYAASTYS